MSKTIASLIAFLTGIALTIIVAWLLEMGFNPETEVVLKGSCNDENRPTDQQISASTTTMSECTNMINAFQEKFYGEGTYARISPSTSESGAMTSPTKRIGAFISKYTLDALFERDMSSNGVMCYIGTDATGELQYFLTPSRKSSSAAPSLPPPGEPVMLQMASSTWCPTNCPELP